ncbi:MULTISPECIES: hypothetical protein [unclassified Rhodanobacter]|uniref:T4 family baseplate hub assembly chaperone n=1 Tax=unclassified Rhodanobacter TaxID=2621553 RepID=UPI001BE06227|nr:MULTISPECIES: hypothetical protein [unclassified Rhodanobacter]MBT2145752.1 hypothetical protein [Rhodanobacter sp. LX-99]MBT2149751.1 hypothetical protein [Rhodanobacter sp. LX-100]
MHTPTPAQLLQVWERGGDPSAAARGLLLLGCSCDEYSAEAQAALPLGRRDALLLELRERLFGAAIDAVAACPHCAATVEATFRCDDLRLPHADAAASMLEHAARGIRVQFRLPDSRDLLALENCGDAEAARALLLERCVLDARSGDEAHEPRSLPHELQAEIARAMAQADPQADLQLAFRCPHCDHEWQPLFDIARFLWQELHAWALHMLREVDTLAQAYHWAEADILALSPRRRQAYLELCAP